MDLPVTSSSTPAIWKDPANAMASVHGATGRGPTGSPLSWTHETPFLGRDHRHLEPTSRHAVAGIPRLQRDLGRSVRAAVPGPCTRGPKPRWRTRNATSALFPAAESPRNPWGGPQGPRKTKAMNSNESSRMKTPWKVTWPPGWCPGGLFSSATQQKI